MATAVRGSASTTRLRKVECPECGYIARVSRRWLAIGPPECPMHGPMVAPDLDDASYLPEVGELVAEMIGQTDLEFARRSEQQKKATLARQRCAEPECGMFVAKGEMRCPKHNMPF